LKVCLERAGSLYLNQWGRAEVGVVQK